MNERDLTGKTIAKIEKLTVDDYGMSRGVVDIAFTDGVTVRFVASYSDSDVILKFPGDDPFEGIGS